MVGLVLGCSSGLEGIFSRALFTLCTAAPGAQLIAIVVAQINRYRRVAAPAQRQQIKWVVFGMGSGFGCLGLVFLSYALFMVEGCKSMIDLLLSMGAGIPLVI